MNNADFWDSVRAVIAEGFTPEGLQKLDSYAEQFISGRLIYQRFSPREQHGCAAGGETNVIASILAGAEDRADTETEKTVGEFERERECGARQEAVIEQWAKAVGCWTEHVEDILQDSFGEEIAEGGEFVVVTNLSPTLWEWFVRVTNLSQAPWECFVVATNLSQAAGDNIAVTTILSPTAGH